MISIIRKVLLLVNLDWNTEDYLQISEDWMKYKRYKKRESYYWITHDQFKEMFTEVIACMDRESGYHIQKSLDYKIASHMSCKISAKKSTILCLTITQPDRVCCSKDYEYATLRAFIVRQPKNGTNQDTTDVTKTAYFGPTRHSQIEMRLESGEYQFLFDVDCQATDFGRVFVGYT